MAERALGCLNPPTALAAAKTLARIGHGGTNLPDVWDRVVKTAFQGMRSIFPAVRDVLFVFLAEHMSLLSKEQRRLLLQQDHFVDWLDVSWQGDSAWIDPSRGGDYLTRRARLHDETDTARWLALLEDDSRWRSVSARKAWLVMTDSDLTKAPWPIKLYLRLLTFDEAFLRARAAYLWISNGSSDDIALEQIFGEKHPAVVDSALGAMLRRWSSWPPDFRARISRLASEALRSPPMAAAAVRMVTHFEEEGGWFNHDDEKPWELWATLSTSILKALPPETYVNDGRLWTTARDALPSLSQGQAEAFVEAWFGSIDVSTRNRRVDDYTTGVVDALVWPSHLSSKYRRHLLDRILSHVDSRLVVASVGSLVDGWKALSAVERDCVLAVLRSGRPDVRWLGVVAVTRRDPPDAIVKCVLGSPDALRKLETNAVLPDLDTPIVAGLLLYCHHLEELANYGGRCSPEGPWPKLFELVLHHPAHPLFDSALYLLLSRENQGEWAAAQGHWRRLCALGDVHLLDRLFQKLLAFTTWWRHSRLDGLWSILLNATEAAQRGLWLDAIVEKIESIEYHDNLRIFIDLGLTKEILDRVPNDMALHNAIEIWENLRELLSAMDEPLDLTSRMEQLVLGALEKHPPRLIRTYKIVLKRIETLAWIDTDGRLRAQLEASMSKIRESQSRRSTPPRQQAPMPGWIYADECDEELA